MPYDIYGQYLRPGHCEVHPGIHESYPCELCICEDMRHREQEDKYREQYGGSATGTRGLLQGIASRIYS